MKFVSDLFFTDIDFCKPNDRTYSRNLGQHSILARKALFYEKRALFLKKGPPNAILFLGVLHQNKALHNFHKKGQASMVECNIGLEYALNVIQGLDLNFNLYFLTLLRGA